MPPPPPPEQNLEFATACHHHHHQNEHCRKEVQHTTTTTTTVKIDLRMSSAARHHHHHHHFCRTKKNFGFHAAHHHHHLFNCGKKLGFHNSTINKTVRSFSLIGCAKHDKSINQSSKALSCSDSNCGSNWGGSKRVDSNCFGGNYGGNSCSSRGKCCGNLKSRWSQASCL